MIKYFLDIIYPPRCPLCEKLQARRELCGDCRASIHFLEGDFAAPYLKKVWFDRARSCTAYETKVMESIHAFKYSRRFDLLCFFADMLEQEVRRMGGYDVIIPVPLNWLRLIRRGYNQSAMLAYELAKRLEIKVQSSALKKIRNVSPQVGLNREERLKNVKGIFSVNARKLGSLKGAAVLLIDDVITTGATLNECARILKKEAKPLKIDALTVARTL